MDNCRNLDPTAAGLFHRFQKLSLLDPSQSAQTICRTELSRVYIFTEHLKRKQGKCIVCGGAAHGCESLPPGVRSWTRSRDSSALEWSLSQSSQSQREHWLAERRPLSRPSRGSLESLDLLLSVTIQFNQGNYLNPWTFWNLEKILVAMIALA